MILLSSHAVSPARSHLSVRQQQSVCRRRLRPKTPSARPQFTRPRAALHRLNLRPRGIARRSKLIFIAPVYLSLNDFDASLPALWKRGALPSSRCPPPPPQLRDLLRIYSSSVDRLKKTQGNIPSEGESGGPSLCRLPPRCCSRQSFRLNLDPIKSQWAVVTLRRGRRLDTQHTLWKHHESQWCVCGYGKTF